MPFCFPILRGFASEGPVPAHEAATWLRHPQKALLHQVSQQRTADPSRSPGAPCLRPTSGRLRGKLLVGRNKVILCCVRKKRIADRVEAILLVMKYLSKECWLDIRVCAYLFLEGNSCAAKHCHLLTQYVAQSINRLGLCAENHTIIIANDEKVIFFARHPEAILWGDAHRVADFRRDWLVRAAYAVWVAVWVGEHSFIVR